MGERFLKANPPRSEFPVVKRKGEIKKKRETEEREEEKRKKKGLESL